MSETIRYVQGFIQPPRRGGELPPETNLLPPWKRTINSPSGGVMTTSWYAQSSTACMLTYCYNTKQRAFILLTIKIAGHCVNTTVEHYGNVFAHKGGKLENRQFLAKMHQIAPNCISNIQIFPGVTTLTPSPPRTLPCSALRASTRQLLPLNQTAR